MVIQFLVGFASEVVVRRFVRVFVTWIWGCNLFCGYGALVCGSPCVR